MIYFQYYDDEIIVFSGAEKYEVAQLWADTYVWIGCTGWTTCAVH